MHLDSNNQGKESSWFHPVSFFSLDRILFSLRKPDGKILDSVLDAIGYTPMVRCSRLSKKYGVACEILAKCEYFNAGGSVKDRIGLRMILEAERDGILQPGDYIIEPTSGNTGTGLALAAAIKGYNVLITLPEKMSGEKVNMMKALGAQILRTPTEAAWNAPESHIGLALRLNKALDRSHILDQYKNIANPLAHYEWTGQEICDACGDKAPDAVVICAGTGGTITGIARKVKEVFPNCLVVGVDPVGSILAEPAELNDPTATAPYEIEGIGYDFIPTVLDRSSVDRWVKTVDTESFQCARDLIRYEGFLCGGSSGSAMAGVLKFIKEQGWENDASKRIVTLLPDGSRNYMSKFIADEWMIERGFMQPEEEEDEAFKGKTVADLRLSNPVTVTTEATCQEVAKIMLERGYDQIPVVSPTDGSVLGVVTEGNLTLKLKQRKVQPSDSVRGALYAKVKAISPSTTLSVLSRYLDATPFVFVVAEQEVIGAKGVSTIKKAVVGVATRLDLLKFLTH